MKWEMINGLEGGVEGSKRLARNKGMGTWLGFTVYGIEARLINYLMTCLAVMYLNDLSACDMIQTVMTLKEMGRPRML